MKNQDTPAMPQECQAYVEGMKETGLTKREYFLAKSVEGICSNPNAHTMSPDAIARRAISIVNATFEALK